MSKRAPRQIEMFSEPLSLAQEKSLLLRTLVRARRQAMQRPLPGGMSRWQLRNLMRPLPKVTLPR